jgi:hypothetical protein
MEIIEILDKTNNILYRGHDMRHDQENYIFTDILTNKEIKYSKKDVGAYCEYTLGSYERTMKYLNLIKNDSSFTKKEKEKLYRIKNLFSAYYDLKLTKLLGLNNVEKIEDAEFTILLDSYKNLIDNEYKKALLKLDELIATETDSEIIKEIQSVKAELDNNVNEFMVNELPNITVDNICDKWPTLLNPSPIRQIYQ